MERPVILEEPPGSHSAPRLHFGTSGPCLLKVVRQIRPPRKLLLLLRFVMNTVALEVCKGRRVREEKKKKTLEPKLMGKQGKKIKIKIILAVLVSMEEEGSSL